MSRRLSAPGPVAVIGLGQMGTAVAQRLLDAGYEVHGYDIASEARSKAEQMGVYVHDGCAAAAGRARCLITLLPDAQVVEAISDEVIGSARPGAIWLEMSSSHPALTRRLAERATERDFHLVDAPVAGGVSGAEAGTLTIMVAAASELLETARPVLEILGSTILLISERPGDGDLAKTINNLLAAANLALATEGFTLGLAEGLDAEVLLEVLNASSGNSFATHVQLPKFALNGAFDARFTVGQYAKDAGIALDVAKRRGLQLPMSECAGSVWDQLADRGHRNDDFSRIAPITAEAAGVTWPTPYRSKAESEPSS